MFCVCLYSGMDGNVCTYLETKSNVILKCCMIPPPQSMILEFCLPLPWKTKQAKWDARKICWSDKRTCTFTVVMLAMKNYGIFVACTRVSLRNMRLQCLDIETQKIRMGDIVSRFPLVRKTFFTDQKLISFFSSLFKVYHT